MIISSDSEQYDPLAMSPWEVSEDGETWTRVENPRGYRFSRFNVNLNGPQTRAHRVFGPDRNLCLPWGRGIGKSHFMRLLWYLSVASHDGKRRFGLRNGLRTETRGVKIVHIQPTFKSIKDVHADLTDQEVYGPWSFLGGRINHSEWKITFPGGSWIQWFGMKEANAARGIRCDFVTADEGDDIDLGAIQAVVKPWFSAPWSLRQFVVGGTPRRGRYGLLYSMHEAGAIKHTPKCYSFHATYKDAPETVDPAYVEDVKSTTLPEVFRREWECDFDSAEGLVYGGLWNHDLHVKEPPANVHWTEFLVGIDHGWEDPGVLLLVGVQGSGRDAALWAIDEIHRTKTLEADWCDHAKKLQQKWRMRTPANASGTATRWFADPSRPDRIEAFRRAGIWVEPAKNAREDGVAAVADFMAPRPDPNDREGKRRIARLYVSPRCKELISEIGKYRRRRDPKNPDRILDEIEDGNDHCFVAGTMVTTDAGDVPIEDIRAGMRVLTRDGFYPVKAAGMTRENAEVWTLTTSDGHALTGTPNHPVRTESEWRRLDSLQGKTLLCIGGRTTGHAAALVSAPAPVFDLTVDGPPEFFANGVLVHNCMDSLRYAVMSRFGGPDKRRIETGPGWGIAA